MYNQAKDLFQLQTELVEAKVDMAVNLKIDRVVNQITDLKSEMHKDMRDLRHQINGVAINLGNSISALDKRMVAVETKLGIVNDNKSVHRNFILEYVYKFAWIILSSVFMYVYFHFR